MERLYNHCYQMSIGNRKNSYSLFPIPYSLFPIPYSLFPIPYSLSPVNCQLSPIPRLGKSPHRKTGAFTLPGTPLHSRR